VVELNTYALVNEVCNETKYHKEVNPFLLEARHLVGDGLFTVREIVIFTDTIFIRFHYLLLSGSWRGNKLGYCP